MTNLTTEGRLRKITTDHTEYFLSSQRHNIYIGEIYVAKGLN